MSDPVPTPDEIAALLQVEHLLDQRWPETKLDPSTARIAALLELLGSPQRAYPSIHVAGTNGKTSVARLIDALLTALHRRTGRTTSPHLQSAVERISIDGKPITPAQYVNAYTEVEPFVQLVDQQSEAAGGPKMSKFEVLTAMAFAAFADVPIDVAVVEVGMGGRWDATNVVNAPVAVITPIGIDHTDYLGDTIAEIAGEKAGIITRQPDDLVPTDTVAVIAKQVPEAMDVLLAEAVRADAAVAREDSEFAVLSRQVAIGGQVLELQGLSGVYSEIFLPLHGEHQAHNAVLALAAVEAFFGAGADRQLDVEAIRAGFAAVHSPGRMERMRSAPTVFIDAAQSGRGCGAGADPAAGVRLPLPRRGGVGDGGQGRRWHPERARVGVRPDRGHPQRFTAGDGCRVVGVAGRGAFRPGSGDHRHDAVGCHRNRHRVGRGGRRRRRPVRVRNGDHRFGGDGRRGPDPVRTGPAMNDQTPSDQTPGDTRHP
ncbi:hypothetical protein MALV_54900 [Mycolicibacterium alvei]|uniref:Dihydrofolate synthase/folylpolyglutamate synthase n=1 Tax=Mycolicibacterium alvei TaxID=67081 RepID=A0A6N4V226_9MYCO|nr:hypothetical protein MALV_54900 [Mycolicibacterium alvei]